MGEPVVVEQAIDDCALLLEPSQDMKLDNFASLRPSLELLPKLKEIYVDRVDPLVKVVHVPTLWTAMTRELQRPEGMSKSLEAILFAVCLAVISTLKEDECQTLFRGPTSIINSQYRLATRQALSNAGFLSTSSVVTLQAFAIYMVSEVDCCDFLQS